MLCFSLQMKAHCAFCPFVTGVKKVVRSVKTKCARGTCECPPPLQSKPALWQMGPAQTFDAGDGPARKTQKRGRLPMGNEPSNPSSGDGGAPASPTDSAGGSSGCEFACLRVRAARSRTLRPAWPAPPPRSPPAMLPACAAPSSLSARAEGALEALPPPVRSGVRRLASARRILGHARAGRAAAGGGLAATVRAWPRRRCGGRRLAGL